MKWCSGQVSMIYPSERQLRKIYARALLVPVVNASLMMSRLNPDTIGDRGWFGTEARKSDAHPDGFQRLFSGNC
jgi:hypothetical protein